MNAVQRGLLIGAIDGHGVAAALGPTPLHRLRAIDAASAAAALTPNLPARDLRIALCKCGRFGLHLDLL
jgi:hypothetical protein